MNATLSMPPAISPEALYPIEQAQRICGWAKHAWRQRLAEGLPVRYLGNRGFVLGADLISHIRQHGKDARI
jgi:hypothetical protein